MLHVLDTSILIEIARNTPIARAAAEVLREELAISAVTHFEFLRGTQGEAAEATFLDYYPVLPFDRECSTQSSRIFKDLKKKGITSFLYINVLRK